MRLVNYKIRDAYWNEFETTSYNVAKKDGNTILATFLTEVDETTEKEREVFQKHVKKYKEALNKKKRL